MMKIYKKMVNLLRLYWIENKVRIILFPVFIFVLYLFLPMLLLGKSAIQQNNNSQVVNAVGLGITEFWSVFFIATQSQKTMLKPINLTLSVSAETKWIFLFLVTSVLVYFVAFITQFVAIELRNGFTIWYYGADVGLTHLEQITFQKLLKSVVFVSSLQGLMVTGFLTFKKMPALKMMILFLGMMFFVNLLLKYTIGNDVFDDVPNIKEINQFILFIGFWTLNYFLLKKQQLK